MYNVMIGVQFEKNGSSIFLPMVYYTFNGNLSHSKADILFLFKEIMSIPFEDLPTLLSKGTQMEQILIKKRLEGFSFPSLDKVMVTFG